MNEQLIYECLPPLQARNGFKDEIKYLVWNTNAKKKLRYAFTSRQDALQWALDNHSDEVLVIQKRQGFSEDGLYHCNKEWKLEAYFRYQVEKLLQEKNDG